MSYRSWHPGLGRKPGFSDFRPKVTRKKTCNIIQCGFLKFAKPTAAEPLSACRRNSIKSIIILSAILFSGEHTQKDIPNTVNDVFQGHPEINLFFADPLATQSKVMEVCRKCIEEIEQVSKKVISREETLLMPVGHGNRNVEFNSLVENNLGILGDQLGFYKTFTLFASSSQHSFEGMEEKFTSQGFRRVILLPFFFINRVLGQTHIYLRQNFSEKTHTNRIPQGFLP